MNLRKITVVLLLIMFFSACSKTPELSLIDYVDVSFSGVDGKGEVNTKIDHDALEFEMSKYIPEKNKGNETSLLEQFLESFVFIDSLVVEAVPSENLKNGDEVVIKAYKKPTEELDLPIDFKEGSKIVKVEGLKEIEEIDAFEGIEVIYEGTSPYLNYSIRKDNANPLVNSLQYSSDTINGEAKNDEPLVVKITSGLDRLLEDGYRVKETEKEFIPTGMNEYPCTLSDFNKIAREQLLKETDDNLTSYIATSAKSIASLPTEQLLYSFKNEYATFDSSLEKVIFRKAKERKYLNEVNSVTMVYSINVNLESYDSGIGEIEGYNNEVVYFHATIKNISMNSGDLLGIKVDTLILSPLYKTIDEVERELINAYKDRYEIEIMNGEDFLN